MDEHAVLLGTALNTLSYHVARMRIILIDLDRPRENDKMYAQA